MHATRTIRPATGSSVPLLFHDRLAEAVRATWPGQCVPGDVLTRVRAVVETDLGGLRELLAAAVPGRFSVTGGLDRRLLFAERAAGMEGWIVADLSGQPHVSRAWPAWTTGRVALADPASWLSLATLSADAPGRLARPRTVLTSLYHPEWFPLPRFPLAISDLARAARTTLMGQVQLIDMQLGASLDDIVGWVREHRPDIVGVSATFGQHDLMTALLDELEAMPDAPLVLAGGSLTVRNEVALLERYPRLLVARGAGEPTITDVMGYFHGDYDVRRIRGVGYCGGQHGTADDGRRQRRTAVAPNREQNDFLPELDLLDATFAAQGVVQLEVSRGCTSHCSFCPRGHKGSWSGGDPGQLSWMLDAVGRVADRHPAVSRTVYLVDEEFIGRGPDAVARAREIAGTISDAGFAWESSCRVDQVTDPDRDRDWHQERARLWRDLLDAGLRRMLFGIESGVTSILERFVKGTTSEQNARAIRTLSALGVPTRFTYITFDQLMTADELAETTAFLGRTDLLLRPLPGLTPAEIVDGVGDPGFVAAHALGDPFYTEVSYMLVSMECLTGAPYTRAVRDQGLAGHPDPTMGRIDARFADWRIGVCSRRAQMWVDRHFPLDYTLKSLEKVLDGAARQQVRVTRRAFKDAGFRVLSQMVEVIASAAVGEGTDLIEAAENDGGAVDLGAAQRRLDDAVVAILDTAADELTTAVPDAVRRVRPLLPPQSVRLLDRELDRWHRSQGWRLINANDPCST